MIMSPTHGSKIDPVHSRLTSRVYIFQMWYAFVYYIFNGTPPQKKKKIKKKLKKKTYLKSWSVLEINWMCCLMFVYDGYFTEAWIIWPI